MTVILTSLISFLIKTLTYLVSVKKKLLTCTGEYNPPKQEGWQ